MRQDDVIGALIGLIGACGNNPKTENTDLVVIKALAFPLLCPGGGDNAFREMVDEIYAEKSAVAPGCALCASPCGNTSDYDMEQIHQAAEDVRSAKLDILAELQNAAHGIWRCRERGLQAPVSVTFFYKALSMIRYHTELPVLLSLLAEGREVNHRIQETQRGESI